MTRIASHVHPTFAYKIFEAAQWKQFQSDGVFNGSPVDIADGYIHLSSSEQVMGTIDKHFAGHADLIIAKIDLTILGDSVKWEASRGGALFPHIYGALPMLAVLSTE